MKVLTLISSALLALTLSSCSMGGVDVVDSDGARADAAAALDRVETADSIRLKKDAFTVADHWTVFADGVEVAEVGGVTFKTFGQVYSVVSPLGGFMGGEDQEIFELARTAKFYDENQEVTGELKKEIFSLTAEYNLTDEDGDLEAVLKQKFSYKFKGEIKDANGQVEWEFEGKFVSIAPDITLTPVTVDSPVSAMDAIRMVLVASEIYEAEKESNQ